MSPLSFHPRLALLSYLGIGEPKAYSGYHFWGSDSNMCTNDLSTNISASGTAHKHQGLWNQVRDQPTIRTLESGKRPALKLDSTDTFTYIFPSENIYFPKDLTDFSQIKQSLSKSEQSFLFIFAYDELRGSTVHLITHQVNKETSREPMSNMCMDSWCRRVVFF